MQRHPLAEVFTLLVQRAIWIQIMKLEIDGYAMCVNVITTVHNGRYRVTHQVKSSQTPISASFRVDRMTDDGWLNVGIATEAQSIVDVMSCMGTPFE